MGGKIFNSNMSYIVMSVLLDSKLKIVTTAPTYQSCTTVPTTNPAPAQIPTKYSTR